MAGRLLADAIDTGPYAVGSVLAMALGVLGYALRLLMRGTERIDAASEIRAKSLEAELERVQSRCNDDRRRAEAREAQLLARIAELEEQ